MEPMINAILDHVPKPQSIVSIDHPDGAVEVWNVDPALAKLVRDVLMHSAGAPDIVKEA